MKKLIFALVTLGFSFGAIAQTGEWCGTEMSEAQIEWLKNHVQENKGKPMYRTITDTHMIPVVLHVVRRTDGTGGPSVADVTTEICNMNENYLDSVGFYFYVREIEFIDNNDFYDHTLADFILMASYYHNNVVNIYFVPPDPANSLCGYFTPGQDAVIIYSNCMTAGNSATTTHEVGHYFSLPHPHFGWEGTEAGNWTSAPPLAQRESIVKDSAHPCFNCDQTADFFCDTDADYNLGNTRWACGATAMQDSCLARHTEQTEVTFLSSNPADYAGTESFINLFTSEDATQYSIHFDHPSNTADPTTATGTLAEVSLTGVLSVADSIASAFAARVNMISGMSALRTGNKVVVTNTWGSTHSGATDASEADLSTEISLSVIRQGETMNYHFDRDPLLWMSYSVDGCANRFSDEQVTAMRANLMTSRTDLLVTADPDIIPGLTIPTLSTPIDGSPVAHAIDYVYFEWTEVPEALLGYHIIVYKSTPSNPAYSAISPTNKHHALGIALDPSTTYKWRVKPLHPTYVCEGYSSIFEFTTGAHFSNINEPSDLLSSVTVFPNPVRGSEFNVNIISEYEGSANFKVLNITGQEVFSGNVELTNGTNDIHMDMIHQVSGLHLLRIEIEGQVIERKFVVTD